jgi:peptide/nickel transport system substrate-binding protein
MAYPTLCNTVVITGDEANRIIIVQCPVSEWVNAVTLFPDFCTIMPRDAVEKFGNMNEWQNSIGTGAFILTDFISNISAILTRNPNYWEINPIDPGKGDQLPYLDRVKLLIITDNSTRLAAMRTKKIDTISSEYQDIKELLNSPDIRSMMYTSDSSYVISMRTDRADSPFSKKEVRQALTLATDFNLIKNQYYSGKADILSWPITYTKENEAAYVPLEKLPANVQELYSHNVTKAKELLTAAGYPTLKTTVICSNTPTHIDFLSSINYMWRDVGVDLTIKAMDYATWTSRVRARNYDANEMLYCYSTGVWQRAYNINGSSQYNSSYVNDPLVAEVVAKMTEYVGIDEAKLAQLHADMMPYVIEQCWVIPKPTPYSYIIWWPWVKNWNGEQHVGYYNYPSYLKYIWMDLALKQ